VTAQARATDNPRVSARSTSPPWWKAYVAPTVIIAVVLGAAARFEYRMDGPDGRLRTVETGLAEMRGSLNRYRADALGLESAQIERVSLRPGAGFRATLTDGVGSTRYDLTDTILEIGPDRITFRIEGKVDNATMPNIVVSMPLRPGSLTPIHGMVVRGLPTLAIAILDRSPDAAVIAVGPLKTENAA
jgi:hypothetical protein